jgi:hypothetical protein
MNPIEKEQHKRVFWLAYGADKSLGTIDDSCMLFKESDIVGVEVPSNM